MHLHQAGVSLEILTTCVKDFLSDWSTNYYKEGTTMEGGLVVKRFRAKKRNKEKFDLVNAKLMHGQIPLRDEEEKIYIQEMINSPDLYWYMKKHEEEYAVFLFIPYMFGTTYYGMQVCPEKSVLIPCLHDERYIYMEIFQKLFSKIVGMIFLAEPESELARKVYGLEQVRTETIGGGVSTDIVCDPNRFRKKYKIKEPYFLYAGRKDRGKNVHTLLNYFALYKQRTNSSLKLVLIGGGEIAVPKDLKHEIYDLGFLPAQDKYDAYGAAQFLCQPSVNESFSIVMMESWICNRPVIVNEKCNVTTHFVKTANGGLYFNDYFEFEGCFRYMEQNPQCASVMGEQGKNYVLDHFSWDVIIRKFRNYLEKHFG